MFASAFTFAASRFASSEDSGKLATFLRDASNSVGDDGTEDGGVEAPGVEGPEVVSLIVLRCWPDGF